MNNPQAIRMIEVIRRKAAEIKEDAKAIYGPDGRDVKLATLIELLAEAVLDLECVEE